MLSKVYEVIIIGSGPAGITAGIYASRKEMKTLIISQDIGGQMAKTFTIENAPGIEATDGVSLAFKMQAQAESFGTEFIQAEIIKINHSKHKQIFNLLDKDGQEYQAKSVILAFGLEKRKLGVSNESQFENKGLSYCVTCDGPTFKKRQVAVIGGGNAGAEAVEFLAKICPKIYWLEALDEIQADEIFKNRIKKLTNVKILTATKIVEFLGVGQLAGAKIETKKEKRELKFTGAIVEIGYQTNTSWLDDLVVVDKRGQIKVDPWGHTATPGLFAAGDVTDVKYKQIVVAEGMGAVAALEAYEFVSNL